MPSGARTIEQGRPRTCGIRLRRRLSRQQFAASDLVPVREIEQHGVDRVRVTRALRKPTGKKNALRSAGVPADPIESEQQSVAPMDNYQLNQLPAIGRASHAFVSQQQFNRELIKAALVSL